jgi:putative abortive phage resistance protein
MKLTSGCQGGCVLRYLSLANWRSVYAPVEFSMVATGERRHGARLARLGRTRVLPVAAIYGANAAGKSTLIEGLAALQALVTEARSKTEVLPVVPHELQGHGEPTSFGVEFVVAAPGDGPGRRRDWLFYYEVSADRYRILSESLARLRTKDEEVLFERRDDEVEFFGDLEEEPTALAVKRLLAPNRTVLGSLGEVDGVPEMIGRAWNWFREQLQVITPRSDFYMLPARIAQDNLFAHAMSRGLSTADTGISQIKLEDFSASSVLSVDDAKEFSNRLAADGGMVVLSRWGGHALLSLDDNGDLRAQRLVTVHEGEPDPDGAATESFTLPLSEESDGTLRFINLLPILFQLAEGSSRRVFVVDELESSMHPLLTEELIRSFLDELGGEDRRQLIFTTHELQLMRAPLLRRDEMWLVDKAAGQSKLTRLSDFSSEGVRKDADLLRFYTSGRLGGVPRM